LTETTQVNSDSFGVTDYYTGDIKWKLGPDQYLMETTLSTPLIGYQTLMTKLDVK